MIASPKPNRRWPTQGQGLILERKEAVGLKIDPVDGGAEFITSAYTNTAGPSKPAICSSH
jgi:hypothetical protein